jgi:hypothetical protein
MRTRLPTGTLGAGPESALSPTRTLVRRWPCEISERIDDVDFSPVGKICSFCGLVGTSETRFAGGLGAMMCADCLGFYHATFESEEASEAISRPPWNDMNDTELLSKLPLIAASAEQVNQFMGDWIELIRERKLSWAAIGEAMGVSRQAAWERFTRATAKDTSASAG